MGVGSAPWGGGGGSLMQPPPPPRHNQNTFGPKEGQNEQWREANRRRQRQTIRYRGPCANPPPPDTHHPPIFVVAQLLGSLIIAAWGAGTSAITLVLMRYAVKKVRMSNSLEVSQIKPQRMTATSDASPILSGGSAVSLQPGPEAPQGELVLVFTDIQASTELWEANADAMQEGLAAHDQVLRTTLQEFSGFEVWREAVGGAAAMELRPSQGGPHPRRRAGCHGGQGAATRDLCRGWTLRWSPIRTFSIQRGGGISECLFSFDLFLRKAPRAVCRLLTSFSFPLVNCMCCLLC